MAVHVAYISPMLVLNGTPISKEEAEISQVLKANTEMRILENASIPNTIGNPGVTDYIGMEDSDGFKVTQINNTMIITQS